MKSILATSYFLLSSGAASAKSSHLPKEESTRPKSVAGLRELQKLANGKDRGLFIDVLSGFGTGLDCGDACGDPDKCTSFMGASPDPSVLEASCDAGCIPQVALTTCDQLCGDDDAPAISVQRLNLFDSAVELMCGNCKFYQCCVGDYESYEYCKQNLPDTDSFLPNLGNSPEMDSLLPGLGDLPDLDALIPGGLDTEDLPDIGSIVPWGAVSSSSDSDIASGLSVLGQFVGSSLDCPQTCDSPELCQSAFMGMGSMGGQALKDACNEGCLPIVYSPSCEEICGNVNVPEFMGSVVGMACDSCKFMECCAGDQSEGEKFETCKELLPTMNNLLPDIDWETIHAAEWNHTWGSGLDWTGIDMASGLSGLVENIHSLFDQALGDFDDAFPVTCNSETCPIDGLCSMGIIHLSNVNFEDACNNSTFFECADGLEEMCANECDGAKSGGFLSESFCSLCNIATCCKNKDEVTSFEDCALGALPPEISDAIEGIANVMENITDTIIDAFDQLDEIEDTAEVPEDLSGSPADVSVESSPSEPSENQEMPANDSDSEPIDSPTVAMDTLDSSQQDLNLEGSSEDPTIASGGAPSESSESPGTPAEDSAALALDPSAAAVLEVSRFETVLDSGSPASEMSMFLAVACLITLVYVAI